MQALDQGFQPRCFRPIGTAQLGGDRNRFTRARIAGARAGLMLGEAAGDIGGDAGIEAAIGAFEQVQVPGMVGWRGHFGFEIEGAAAKPAL